MTMVYQKSIEHGVPSRIEKACVSAGDGVAPQRPTSPQQWPLAASARSAHLPLARPLSAEALSWQGSPLQARRASG